MIRCTLDKAFAELLAYYRAAEKELPFVKARALYNTAAATKRDMPAVFREHFTIRRNQDNPWPARGIRLDPPSMSAIKARGGNSVTIGSIDPIMELLAHGGAKKGNGEGVSVPIVGGARPAWEKVVPRSMQIKQIRSKRGAFEVKTASGKRLIMQRTSKRKPAKLLATLHASVNIRKQISLEEILAQKLSEHFASAMIEAFEYAAKHPKR